MKYLLTIVVSLLFMSVLPAQEWGVGFKIGMTRSQFEGPSEVFMGESLEQYEGLNGFAIGGSISLKMSKLWGFTGEILYNQRGGKYSYEGPGYFVFDRGASDELIAMGMKEVDLRISNAYIELPLSAYIRPFKFVEISGGAYVGFLVNATAGGEFNLADGRVGNATVEDFSITLDYNFYRDEAGFDDGNETQTVQVGGEFRQIPETANAYYFFNQKESGSTYRTLDYGLQAGLSFRISRGIYIGTRYSLGLADVSNEDYNVSRKEINPDGSFVPLDETDKNRSWQFFFGFSF